jgi:hypothetical protein
MLTPAKDLNSLREQLGAEGVEFLMASFADMHGVSKTKMVPLAHGPGWGVETLPKGAAALGNGLIRRTLPSLARSLRQ